MPSRILLCGISAAAIVATTTACGGGSSSSGSSGSMGQELKGASFTVSSKDFTESILLGKITEYLLKAHGASFTDKTDIKGSVNTRDALTAGQVDMYWEYTGTAWITYLKNTKPIADPAAQYQAVKSADAANGIAWLTPAPMNDTYALATRAGEADKLGVHALSDLAKLSPSDATFCIESEFSTRDDGFPGMTRAYGVTSGKDQVKMLDTGVIYTETAKGATCNFGEVFATDGRISSLKLTVLKDDKAFFPSYNAALTLKQSLLAKYPAIATIVDPVAAKLDDATVTELNAEVDAQGLPADQVAQDWLKKNGFVK
jgi:osmoprotectant transport system substrate-binding protein